MHKLTRTRAITLGQKGFSHVEFFVAAIVIVSVAIIGIRVLKMGHALTSSGSTSSCTVSAELVPSCGAWFSSYEGGKAADLTAKEAEAGRTFDIAHFYDSWGTKNIPDADQASLANNHYLYINIQSHLSSGAGVCWSDIADGSQDAAIDTMASSIKAFGKKMFISYNHEAEANVGTSCAGTKYGTASDYAAAYRHIHDRFATDGVTNVVWVWGMMGNPQTSTPATLYASLWPGDSYVDWVAYDPYNWDTCQNAPWKSFYTTAANFYNWFNQNSGSGHDYSSKPYMLAETGTLDDPSNATNKENWFANMSAQAAQLPNIKAVIYFDTLVPDNAGVTCNWGWDNSAADAAGFKAAASASYFNQSHNPDTTPPSTPGNLHTTATSTTTISIAWDASTDNVGVMGYHVYLDGNEVSTQAGTTYTASNLSSNTSHTFTIRAYDANNNISSAGSLTATTLPPPSPVISSFTATPSSLTVGKSTTLSWSTENTTGCSVSPGGPTNTTATSWTTPVFSSSGTDTYTLMCHNGANVNSTKTVGVTVSQDTGTIVGIGLGNKCLENYNDQMVDFNKIDLDQCNGTKAQQWTINNNGTIVNADGYCLDVHWDSTANNTNVDLFHCNGTKAQIWEVNTSNNTITSPQSGLCLDDHWASTANFNPIWMHTCNGTSAQQWKME